MTATDELGFAWPAEDHCLWCAERLLSGERLAPDPVGTPVGPRRQHFECALRSVVGGLNHLNGRCSCCGGDLPPDPAGISKRVAAQLAAQAWRARNPPEPEPTYRLTPDGGRERVSAQVAAQVWAPTYRITHGGRAILCLMCRKESWNRGDVNNLYCGACSRFHTEDRP